jgi:proteasome accessory factor B
MQPLERLVNLVALLLDSRRPLTFEEIRGRMAEAYEQDDLDSAKRMFERDKGILRDIGVPIEVVTTDVWETEQGYTIPKDEYYLPEISFSAEEIGALFVAAHAGREDPWAEEAVRKLLYGSEGGVLVGVTPLAVAGDGPSDARLRQAAEAVAGQRTVRFLYRTSKGEEGERRVDAHGLAIRGGHWYLVGLDRDRNEIRSFRLTRVASDVSDEGAGSAPPEGFRAADHIQAGPWGPGEPRRHAVIAFAPEVAWWATKGVQGAETLSERPDGWTTASIPLAAGEGLASWVLGFGPEAVVLEPPELRDEVVRRLEEILDAP